MKKIKKVKSLKFSNVQTQSRKQNDWFFKSVLGDRKIK